MASPQPIAQPAWRVATPCNSQPRAPARSQSASQLPPRNARHSMSAACPSKLTALQTIRPPGLSASQAAAKSPASLTPPPTKIASGASAPAKYLRRLPLTHLANAELRAKPHCAPHARRAPGDFSKPKARIEAWLSSHSMATEPLPSPISQSSSPGAGRSAESVNARISRLVICPSCSK